MDIQPLLTGKPPISAGPKVGDAVGKSDGGFGKALGEAIDSLDRLQREADVQSAQLAAGDPVELHEVMLAQDQASLSLQLAIQVRNKLVEAYQDVMRMQV